MKSLLRLALFLTIPFSVSQAGVLRGGATRPGYSSEFVLTDQHAFEREWKFPRDRATVLVVADQKGSEQIASWVVPLYARYQKRIDISGVAALPGIPSAFHGLFRREFKKRLTYSVLLDWSGEVSKTFGIEAGVANLFVIGRDGRITEKQTGAATERTLKEVMKAVDQAAGR